MTPLLCLATLGLFCVDKGILNKEATLPVSCGRIPYSSWQKYNAPFGRGGIRTPLGISVRSEVLATVVQTYKHLSGRTDYIPQILLLAFLVTMVTKTRMTLNHF
jgi:hypothetical protein